MKSIFNKYRKIKFDIVTSFFVLITVTILSTIMYTIKGYHKSVYSFTSQHASDLSNSIAHQLENYFSSIAKLLQTIEESIDDSADIFEDPRIKRVYNSVVREYANVLSIYLTNPQGRFFQSRRIFPNSEFQNKVLGKVPLKTAFADRYLVFQEEQSKEKWIYFDELGQEVAQETLSASHYNPLRRDWYMETEQKRKGVWSDVYIFKTSKILGVTYSLPVLSKKDNRFLGVIATDITIDNINVFLKSIKFSTNARLYVVNQKNEIIASSSGVIFDNQDKSDEMKILLAENSKDTALHKALKESLVSEKEFSLINIDDIDYLSNVRAFKDSVAGLKLVIIAPVDDFISTFAKTLNMTFIIAGILFGLSIVLIYYVAIRISKPLMQLAAEARKIEQLKLDKYQPVHSNIEEIDILSKTIESLHSSIGIFSKFLPKDLVYKLLQKNVPFTLGGKNDELTIMFTDIVNFTNISEHIPAEYLMQHVSDYFDKMSQVIMKHKGTIDKYIGDSIMALWGAPNPDNNQAYNACLAALACQSRLSSLNETWAGLNKPQFFTRIGIHTGSVVVGNMGSRDRMNYTVLRDNVNLASRLESLNKIYGTQILVSDTIVEKTERYFLFRLVDKVAVKGKMGSIKVYELIDIKDESKENMKEKTDYCVKAKDAFEDYAAKNWNKAIEKYQRIQKDYPWGHTIASIMIERCKYYKRTPPKGDWDGSIHLDKK